MKDGYKVIDMDTHVNPSMEVLEKYVDPGFRARLPELKPYYREHKRARPDGTVQTSVGMTVAPIPYDRFPGEAPRAEHTQAVPGGRTALEGRVITHHRRAVQPGIDEENADGRIADMDLEGRDIDFIFPGTWVASCTALDVTLAEGLYRAYHRYMHDYTVQYPERLKSAVQLPGADVAWAVQELKALVQEKWLAAVWLHLPEGKPIDHPDFEPLWATMNDLDLPLIHHSFFVEPPYFPGYRDIWGNAAVARTAAHPWGAARFCAYLIVSGIFDRYPNFRAAVAEVGHGWLPQWVIRLGQMTQYVSGTTPKLHYTPLEYVQQGRFRCAAEPFEGPAMTKACIDILGPEALMHQSDYPHGEAYFPETASMVLNWPIWSGLGEQALRQHMYDNAAAFLRLL